MVVGKPSVVTPSMIACSISAGDMPQSSARWVCDCTLPNAQVDYYCVWMHGGIHKPALEGDEDCFPVVPVEDKSWSTIKALFR